MKHFLSGSAGDYAAACLLAILLAASWMFPQVSWLLWPVAVAGAVPTLLGALRAAVKRRISIDTFNLFAVIVAAAYGQVQSLAFIVLMLASARILQRSTESRTRRTLEELLKLKPAQALVERGGKLQEIASSSVLIGEIVVVREGSRVPVDGLVVHGRALINESSVTGESLPAAKSVGSRVMSGTLNESGLVKVKTLASGKDSTIERMARLVQEAARHKSPSEALADRFASFFLPAVLVIGVLVWVLSRNVEMVAALFLVACADDMAVAIPLAMTAALGRAAQRGVVVKGGEFIERLAKMRTLVLDKTGTLTYGRFAVRKVELEKGVDEKTFWHLAGSAELFSEHPVGRAIVARAVKKAGTFAEPERVAVHRGSGVWALVGGVPVAVGDASILQAANMVLPKLQAKKVQDRLAASGQTCVAVLAKRKLLGFIYVDDRPRRQSKESIARLRRLGVRSVIMFTGDNKSAARRVALAMGISEVHDRMLPEDKVRGLEELVGQGKVVAMAGDGINDAAALARADVGIAMGSSGAAVTVEAGDVVIVNDDLAALPFVVEYSRRAMSVIRWDVAIWAGTNAIGFLLVFLGLLPPAMAAAFNFFTDFLPLANSARLFFFRRSA